MIQYPMIFSASSKSEGDSGLPWSVAAGPYESNCSIPKEFGGEGGAFSPEDFYLLALTNCFLATFKVFASNSKLKFDAIRVTSELTLDKGDQGQPLAKVCSLRIFIEGADNITRIKTVLEKVAKSGILLNSVKTMLCFEFNINGERLQ